jgi:hypothetical protein
VQKDKTTPKIIPPKIIYEKKRKRNKSNVWSRFKRYCIHVTRKKFSHTLPTIVRSKAERNRCKRARQRALPHAAKGTRGKRPVFWPGNPSRLPRE